MEGFRIDLKTFLSLAMPNQYSQVSESKYQAGFGVIILGQNPQTLYIVLPYPSKKFYLVTQLRNGY